MLFLNNKMSSFPKPSTPTKNRLNVKPTTPTKSKSNSCPSVNHTSSTKLLEEINLLLHLETMKRTKDNEIMFRQKVEEAYRVFEERRNKYFNLVAKYAALVKMACTRKVLLQNKLIDLPTELHKEDLKNIKEKLSSDSANDYISTAELNKFKQILHNMENYKNLEMQRSELVDLQNATDAIHYSIEAIEISLENCIPQGLDYFTDTLDMANYPKLLNEYEQNEN